MPTKDLAPFSYISPQKNPLFNDKVWTYYRILVSKRVKSQKTEKMGQPTNPATAPPQKFLLLLRYNLFIGVDKMRFKKITVTVSVRLSATVWVSLVLLFCITVSVRVSLLLFVSSNTFGASSVAICRRWMNELMNLLDIQITISVKQERRVYKILVAFAQRCVYNKSVGLYARVCI